MTIRNARFNTFTRIGARCALVATGALAAVACTVGQGTVAEPEGTSSQSSALTWNQDFFDDFNGSSLDGNNWQDQILWVNNELQCYDNGYNENGQHKTVDVSNSTLNLRVINTGVVSNCNNWDKYGNQHPPTQYRGGRVATKNRKEFNQGRWTARLKLYSWTYGGGYGQASGLAGMFPAWWVLGGRNNEAPVQEGDENVCWPMPGSSEIDIMEHFGNSGANGFGARPIQYTGGGCNSGNWQTYNHALGSDLSNFHEYQLEVGNDVIFRIDNNQVASNGGVGGNYNEPMFAILNYAINGNMDGNSKEYAMTIDWVKHESASSSSGGGGGGGGGCTAGRTTSIKANANGLYASARNDDSAKRVMAVASSVQGWETFDIVDAGNGNVALRSHMNNLYVSANMNDANKSLVAQWATTIGGWETFQFVNQGNGWYGLKSNANGLYVSADRNNASTPLEAKWATTVGSWEMFSCQ